MRGSSKKKRVALALLAGALVSSAFVFRDDAGVVDENTRALLDVITAGAWDDAAIEAVQAAADAGADLQFRYPPDNRTILGVLIKDCYGCRNQYLMAKTLIAAGADVNARTDRGLTVLHWAALFNDVEMVKLFLDAGAEVVGDEHGITPLYFSVHNKNPSIAMMKLLHERLEPDYWASSDGWETMRSAIKLSPADVLEALVDMGGRLLPAALIIAANKSKDPDVIRFLIADRRGFDVPFQNLTSTMMDEFENTMGEVALYIAASVNSNPEVLRVLVEAGVNVNAVVGAKHDVTPMTAVQAAAMFNENLNVLLYLLEAGADPCVNGGIERIERGVVTGMRAVLPAVSEVRRAFAESSVACEGAEKILARERFWEDGVSAETVRAAIRAGADVNASSTDDFPVWQADVADAAPLHFAVSRQGVEELHEIVRILIEAGADVNARAGQGYTPLHVAAFHGAVETARLLLKNGAKNTPNDCGEMPFLFAAGRGPKGIEMMKFLSEAFAVDVNKATSAAPGCRDTTPMHIAARYSSAEAMEWMLSLGGDLKARGSVGSRPVFFAASNEDPNMLRFFMEKGDDLLSPNDVGVTPFLAASRTQKTPELLNALLDRGADFHVSSYPFHVLVDAGHRAAASVVQFLVEADGEHLHTVDPRLGPYGTVGEAALVGAAWFNPDPDVLRVLVAAGVDVNAKAYTYHGWSDVLSPRTALQAAVLVDAPPAVVLYLLEAGANPCEEGAIGFTSFQMVHHAEALSRNKAVMRAFSKKSTACPKGSLPARDWMTNKINENGLLASIKL